MPAAWLGLRTSVVPSIPSTDTTHTRPVFLTVAVIFWLISSPWCPGRIGQSHGRSRDRPRGDRKSTRLNSSHVAISYAVFCLKKKTATEVEPNSKMTSEPVSHVAV